MHPPSLAPSTRGVLPPKNFLTIAPTITYAMGAMVGLTVLFLLVNWAALIYYRKHKIMKFSQGNILQGKGIGEEGGREGAVSRAHVGRHTRRSNFSLSCLLPSFLLSPLQP